MLPRKNSTVPNPGFASPHLAGGSLGPGRPLNLVTSQKTFRASASQTLETDSPQSETFSKDTPISPVMPPRPSPLPQLPPRGLRRQSTRKATYETFGSAFEFPQQPRPLNIMPIPPSPPEPGSPLPPITTQPRMPTTGVGGFAMPSPHRHGHQHTTDGSYGFDTILSPRSDPGRLHYESADISGGIHANLWPTYNKISQVFDEKRLSKWNGDLDVLLIFAALFSAITTSFLVVSLANLGPDYSQQSALLLYQLLNGRDPNLESISDPTAPFQPTASAIAVNCLWFVSLSASLGASFGAMICKEWLTEYSDGAHPVVDLLRACQRQARFTAFQRWNVHTIISLLPPILHSSVLLFFTGAVVYLWETDLNVAIVYLVIGGIFGISYFLSTFLPFVTNAPFRPYSTLLLHRVTVVIGKVIIPIVDVVAHGGYLVLRFVAGAILWPFAQTIFSKGALHTWYMHAQTILPGEWKHLRVWWENAFDDSLEKIDTSQKVQEEAVLWLAQMPLDQVESKAVVSSLALITASRPHRFPKPVVVFLNLTLEGAFRETTSQAQAEVGINCVLVLGHIKYQSVVDHNSDQDHNVGGIPVTPLVAWAAQQLTIGAFEEQFNTTHSEGVQARLLTAAAWLSPVDATEEVMPEGETMKIQDRWEFLKRIRMMLEHHVRGDKPLDNKVLISLIHGMHACIPRGNYGSAAAITSFLPLICEDYDSPWSEDKSVLRALITYALDLLSLERKKPLVDRAIEFEELASELIDALMVHTTYTDAIAFGFWLVYRVPHAFRSRKSILTDITYMWTSTNEAIPDDLRKRINFHAVDAFVAAAQCHVIAKGSLPRLAVNNALNLLKAALEDEYSRPMATYAVAMILHLGTSTQAVTIGRGVDAESFTNILNTIRSDLEKNAAEEDILDLYIYSTLTLLKLRRNVLDLERVKALIREMDKTIGDPVLGDPGATRDSKTEMSAELDRMRWKAIYLSGLLFRFLPPGEWEAPTERLRERVRKLLRGGELLLTRDYERCIEPLDMELLELTTPAEQGGLAYTAFDVWIREFPLFPLAGSVD